MCIYIIPVHFDLELKFTFLLCTLYGLLVCVLQNLIHTLRILLIDHQLVRRRRLVALRLTRKWHIIVDLL